LRCWQLTNCRFVLGYPSALESLNQAIPNTNQQFRILARFNIKPKPGRVNPITTDDLTAMPDSSGPYALLEYTGALPRAKLYSKWQCNTNDQALLEQLASPDFDPDQSVLLAGELPAELPPATRNPDAGTVNFASYSAKDIVLKTDAPAPAVLLLNDHYDPNWKVSVDGRTEPLLCCNFIMRGVYLTAGAHTVDFKFQAHNKLLYLGLFMDGLGLLLLTVVVFVRAPLANPT